MKLKLRIAEGNDFSPKVLKYLKMYFEVDLAPCSENELPTIFNSYDIFWFRLGFLIDKELIRKSSKLKIIATPVTGIDHIDEQACIRKGIKIACLKGEYDFLKDVRATAEHTLALTLSLMRLIPQSIIDTRSGNWNRDLYRGNELFKKTVGVIGLGRLGEITSEYFSAFGCSVFYYDVKEAESLNAQKVDTLEQIAKCDIVTIHVSYSRDTHHLIGDSFFKNCNPNMFFINTARGGIVNEESLLSALKNSKIKGAALDVIQKEHHINSQNKLIEYARLHDNLVITPHIGGNTFESFEKTEMFLFKKVLNMLSIVA